LPAEPFRQAHRVTQRSSRTEPANTSLLSERNGAHRARVADDRRSIIDIGNPASIEWPRAAAPGESIDGGGTLQGANRRVADVQPVARASGFDRDPSLHRLCLRVEHL